MRRKQKDQNLSQAPSRRDFMWKSGCAALGVSSMATTIWDLRLLNAAMAQTSTPITDYKALVCLFLYGGNDSNNLLIPTDSTTYNQYAVSRGVLAIPQVGQPGGALPLSPLTSDGHTYGVHPACLEIQGLFNSGHLGFSCNTGTLVYPLTRTTYFNNSVPKPAQLFSHNDQQVQWQTSVADKPSNTGWGGRAADVINASANGTSNVSMTISLGGQNTFEIGRLVSEYNISTSGAPSPTSGLGSGAASQLQALNDLIGYRGTNVATVADPGYSAQYDITTLHPNLYERSFAITSRNGINNATTVNNATSGLTNTNAAFNTFNSLYGDSAHLSGFAQQLRMIAKMIYGRTALGHKRQIFFAAVGGYDLHGTEGASTGSHANLLSDLSRAMKGFYDATVALGVGSSVTAFTMSDFGRTFPVNGGAGTDHGWGSHHMVMGGAVQGQRLYGQFPDLTIKGQNDTDTGRWIPATSCDEYFATLAKWFGISSTDLTGSVLPNLSHFAHPDLGFMGP